MANSLAELEVFGLERLLDLRLPVPRRVLLLLLLLRGRGRACGQAVQHLPDVEFPHGLAAQGGGLSVSSRPPGEPRHRVGRSPSRWRLRSRSAKERRAADNPNRKGCDDGRTAASPLPPRPPRAAVAPDAASSPGRGRAPAVPRRCRCRRRRRIHGPAAPQSLGASRARPPLSAAARPSWPGHPEPVFAPPTALSQAARPLAVTSRQPRSPAPNARPSRRRAAVPAPAAAVAAAGPPRSGLPGAHARRRPRPRPAA